MSNIAQEGDPLALVQSIHQDKDGWLGKRTTSVFVPPSPPIGGLEGPSPQPHYRDRLLVRQWMNEFAAPPILQKTLDV